MGVPVPLPPPVAGRPYAAALVGWPADVALSARAEDRPSHLQTFSLSLWAPPTFS